MDTTAHTLPIAITVAAVKPKAPPRLLRTPFGPVDDTSTAAHYVLDDTFASDGRLGVAVDAADPKRLALVPVFPGRLTFKPADPAAVPADPTAPGTAVPGDLFLVASAAAQKIFGRAVPDFTLGLIFVYFGVTLTPEFFAGTVADPLKDKDGNIFVVVNGKKKKEKKTPAEVARLFALGTFSVDVNAAPDAPRSVFPVLAPATGAPSAAAAFGLGIRQRWNPDDKSDPYLLADLTREQILDPGAWVSLPVSYYFRNLALDWSEVGADGQAKHPFLAAVAASETAAGRWQRMRLKVPDAKLGTVQTSLENLTLHAAAKGTTTPLLWEARGNMVGEVFARRPDGETFDLWATDALGTAVNLRDAGGKSVPLLTLAWDAPAAGKDPAPLEVTVDRLAFDDPLAGAFRAVEKGMRDRNGLTYSKKGKALYRHALVVPLKKVLRGFGYGTVATETPEFDDRLEVALREFQREAKLPDRTVNGTPGTVTVTYTGGITGLYDEATRTELQLWRDSHHTARHRITVGSGAAAIPDVNFVDASILKRRVWMDGDDELGVTTGPGVAFPTAGSSSTHKEKVWTWIAATAGLPGQTWQHRAISEIAFNEGNGYFEALNTWDGAFLSIGISQWTIGVGRNNPQGELPAVLAEKLSKADFDRLIGRFGLDVDRDHVKEEPGKRITTLLLDGQPVTGAAKDGMRSLRWSARFVELAHTPEFRRAQYDALLDRIGRVMEMVIVYPGGPPQPKATIGALMQTEFLRALIVDHHVNAPGTVVKSLNACCAALRDPTRLQSATTGTTWHAEAKAVLEAKKAGEQAQVNRLTAEKTALEATQTKLQTELADLQKKKGELEADTKPHVAEIQALKKRIAEINPQLPKLAAQIAGKQADIDEHQTVVDELTAEIPTLKPTLEAIEKQCGTADTKALKVKSGATVKDAVIGNLADDGTVTGMTRAQADALTELYHFRRRYLSRMTDPERRYQNILSGKSGSGLGALLQDPGVFTP